VIIFALAAIFAALLTACSPAASSTPEATPQTSPAASAQSQHRLLIAITELTPDTQRLPFVVLGPDNALVENAQATVSFLRVIDREEGTAEFVARDVPAPYRKLEYEYPHEHTGGEVHLHQEAAGVYVPTDLPFDAPGLWLAQARLTPTDGGEPIDAGAIFEVQETAFTPAIGAPAPKSDSPTAADVADLSEISSREAPIPSMYQMSVAEAVSSGKPSVIAFTTPAYCQTRLCGPVLEGVVQVMPEYQDRVVFVHVEPYKLDLLRTEGKFELVPAAQEWGLPSEPWVFIVDAQGNIAAKFEGIVTADELDAALAAVTA
jgi:hypothetical protein